MYSAELNSGTKSVMKYHILHDFRTSTLSKKESSAHFKDLHKLELLTNFYVNPTSLTGGIMT